MFETILFYFSRFIILLVIIGHLNSEEMTRENVKLTKKSESNSRGLRLFDLEGFPNPYFPSNVPILNLGVNSNFPTNSQFYPDNNVQDKGVNQILQESGNRWQHFDNSIYKPNIYPENNIVNGPFQLETTTPYSNEGRYPNNVLQNYPYLNQDPYFSKQYPNNENGFVNPYDVQRARPNRYPYFDPNPRNNNNYPMNQTPGWYQGDNFNNRRPINTDQFNRERPNGNPGNFTGNNNQNSSWFTLGNVSGTLNGIPSFGGLSNTARPNNNFSPVQFNRTHNDNGTRTHIDDGIVAIFGRPDIGRYNTTTANATITDRSTETPIQRQCVQECPATPEYNPLCGNNNVTYFNPSRLRCARECGIDVIVIRQGQCNRHTRPSGL